MMANVTKVEEQASWFTTGNSVVTFAYDDAPFTPEKCTVNLHNTWPDDHTTHHYPIGSAQNIYDCDMSAMNQPCETTESLRYNAISGVWLLSAAGIVFLLFAVLFVVDKCGIK